MPATWANLNLCLAENYEGLFTYVQIEAKIEIKATYMLLKTFNFIESTANIVRKKVVTSILPFSLNVFRTFFPQGN